MKKSDIEVGGTYLAKVGRHSAEVRIESENARGGWNAVSVATGKPVRIKDAKHLRSAKADEGATGAATADSDVVPLTQLDMEKKRPKGKKEPKSTAAKAPAPKGADKAKAMSCLDAAAAVLKVEGKPMACKGIVAAMKERGLWSSNAPTPAATLSSAILREMKKGSAASRFKKVGRGLFDLNAGATAGREG